MKRALNVLLITALVAPLMVLTACCEDNGSMGHHYGSK